MSARYRQSRGRSRRQFSRTASGRASHPKNFRSGMGSRGGIRF